MAENEYSLKAKISVDTSDAEAGFKRFSDGLSDVENNAEKAGIGIGKLAAGNAVGALLTKAFSAVTNSLDKAIGRVDTLNNYPKVMQTLGFSADQADKSIEKLGEGIEGLPTALDSIVGNTQQLTATLGDLDKGTETAIALNDMFLAGGQGAEAATRAFTQYNQMLSKGKVDMQSWNTLMEVAPGQMKQLAQEMLGAEADGRALYAALQNGAVSMDDLNAAVIRLDAEGGAGFASFHDQALTATGGIATNIQNLKTAVTKGVANMIQNFQEAAKDNGLPTISDGLQKLKDVVNKAFTSANKVIKKTVSAVAPVIKKLGSGLKVLYDNFDTVASVTFKTVAAFLAMKAAKKVTDWVHGVHGALVKLVAQYGASAAAKTLDTAAEAANTAAKTANTAAEAANTAAAIGNTAATAAETTAVTAATVAQAAFNKVLMANPLGLVIGAVIGLVAAMKALDKIIKKVTPEQQEMIDGYDEAKEAADQNWESIQDGRREYRSYDKQLAASGDTQERLTAAEQEAKDISEARIKVEQDLQKAIENRNALKAQIDADPVKYDDVFGVNKGKDPLYQKWLDSVANVNELSERYYAMETEAQIHAGRMREIQNQAATEQEEIRAKEVSFEEWKQMRLEGIYAAEERALQFAVNNQTVTLDQLSEKNQETVNALHDTWMSYYEASTDLFTALENKSDQSVQSMIDTLAYNQSVVQEFGSNLETLRSRVETLNIDESAREGLTRMLDEFESAGPEMAGKVDSIVQATDEQLMQLGDLMGAAPATAKDSYLSAMDDAAADVAGQMEHIWAQPEEAMREVLNSTKWAELGDDAKEGLIESFKNSGEVAAMAQHLGIDAEDALKGEWGINSPARKFVEMGIYGVLGLANGLTKTGPAVSAAHIMANAVVSAITWLPSRMFSLGAWSGDGFVNGLQSRIGSIMSAANAIANTVSNTISSVMKIGSPSKVTEKLAEWTGEGYVVGLQNMKKAVGRAVDQMLEGGGRFLRPDVAVNGNNYTLALSGAAGGSFNYRSSIDDLREAIENRPIELTTDIVIDGQKVARATARYNRDELNRLDKFDNLRKGVR